MAGQRLLALGFAALALGPACTGDIGSDADGGPPPTDARGDGGADAAEGLADGAGIDAASVDAAAPASDYTPPEFLVCDSVAGNACFAGTPLSGGAQRDNTTGAYATAPSYLAAPFADPGAGLSLHPLPGELDDGVDATGLDGFAAWDHDFERRPRSGVHRGAYAGAADASSWPLALTEKP